MEVVSAVLAVWALQPALASFGDRLVPFRECLVNCTRDTCLNETNYAQFQANQSVALYVLGWSCAEECDHGCMWHTLAWLRDINYTRVPQFHGKWPFRRVWGVQEPASVAFSLSNLGAVLYFHSRVGALPPSTPMRRLWLSYARLTAATWLASTLYHTRDTPLTEALDYFSAFAAILFCFYVSIHRIYGRESGRRWGLGLGLYFLAHITYLSVVKFDYGYNMAANVTAGLLMAGCWLWWMRGECGSEGGWGRVREGAAMLVLATASLGLELLDFPPLAHAFDAHALWHAVTTPLPILWTKFVIKDCNHLTRLQQSKLS